MKKLLFVFRLHDPSYGSEGNPKTLACTLREDNTLSYSFYGGWQDNGTSFSIGNLQLKESLPINASLFKNTTQLMQKVQSILRTGVGSRVVSRYEILNELKPKRQSRKPTQKLVDAVIEDLKESFRVGDYTVLEELLFMIPKKNLVQALPEEQWSNFK